MLMWRRIRWRDRKNVEKHCSEQNNSTEKNGPARQLFNNTGDLLREIF